ncbi:MAG: hypothetical protein LBU05_05890 [Bifidobacteriaceae bacterium]|jgi:hypothetical protein|nr:hypothetical protein [Bifidobacteriaceae bacterium]
MEKDPQTRAPRQLIDSTTHAAWGQAMAAAGYGNRSIKQQGAELTAVQSHPHQPQIGFDTPGLRGDSNDPEPFETDPGHAKRLAYGVIHSYASAVASPSTNAEFRTHLC